MTFRIRIFSREVQINLRAISNFHLFPLQVCWPLGDYQDWRLIGKFTEYTFHVLVFTVNGYRPVSPVKVVRTSEDGKTIPFVNWKVNFSIACGESNKTQLYFLSRQLL